MDGYTRHQFFIQIGNLNIVITELHLSKTITEVSSKILQHIVAQLDVRSKLNKSREDELDFLSDKKYSVAYHFKRNITKDTILLPKNSRHNNEEGLFNKCKIHNRKLFIVVDINQLKSEPTSKYFLRVVEISKSAVKKKKSLKKIAAQSEESVSEVERNINFSDFTLITSHFKRRTPQRIKFPEEKMSAPFSFADDVTCSSKNDRKRKKCSALKKETAADVRDTNLGGTRISETTKCDTGKVSEKHVVKGVFESDLFAVTLFKQDVSKRIEPNKFYPAKSPPQRKTKTFDIQYKGTKVQSNSTQNNRSQCKKTQSSCESDSEDFVEKLKTKKKQKLSHKENNKNSEESEKYKRPKRKKETQSDEKTSSKNESSKDTEKRKKNISSTKENSKNDKNVKKVKNSSASSSKTQRLTFEELINEKGDDEEDDDDLPEIPSVGKLSEVLSNLEEENISLQLEKNRKASAHLTTEEIKTALSQLKVDIQSIFNGETECERHQLYKNGGKDRACLRMEGNLGFLPEQQEEYIGELLLKMFCLQHSKYFDYIMKVLLPETIILVYAKVKDVSIKEARRIIDT